MNDVSVKEYIEALLAERDARYETRFKAQEDGVKLARNNLHWLMGLTIATIVNIVAVAMMLFRR